MTRLDREARVAIEALVSGGTSKAAVARLLGVGESTVLYHAGRMSAGALDGRGGKAFKATRFEEAIASWREAQTDGAITIWRSCTSGWWPNMVMTAACARCSGFGPS